MENKKEEKFYIEVRLFRNLYNGEIEVKGVYTEEQINDMVSNIGRDFIFHSPNSAFNLKYFDTVVIDKKEVYQNE